MSSSCPDNASLTFRLAAAVAIAKACQRDNVEVSDFIAQRRRGSYWQSRYEQQCQDMMRLRHGIENMAHSRAAPQHQQTIFIAADILMWAGQGSLQSELDPTLARACVRMVTSSADQLLLTVNAAIQAPEPYASAIANWLTACAIIQAPDQSSSLITATRLLLTNRPSLRAVMFNAAQQALVDAPQRLNRPWHRRARQWAIRAIFGGQTANSVPMTQAD